MPTKKITTSVFWQIASQATMAILSAVSVKFVAIGLSKELAGNYNSAYSYLQIFAILADFGLYAVSVREVSTAKDKEKTLGTLLVLRTVITCLSLGLGVSIAWFIPAWQSAPLRIGVMIAAFVPFFTLLAGVLRTIFQVQYKMHYVFIAEVSQRIFTTGGMALIIFLGIRSSTSVIIYEVFIGIGAIGALVLFILSLIFSKKLASIKPVFDTKEIVALLRKSVPYGSAFFCMALYRQFDLTLIALLRPDFEVQNAEYGFALRIAEMAYLVPTFLLNSALPLLSERENEQKDTRVLMGKIFLVVLLLGSISSLFAFFWSTPIMELLTTKSYLRGTTQFGADSALKLLSIPMFLNGIVQCWFYILLTTHRWRPLVQAMICAALLSVLLNIFWIPVDGFIGAIRTSSIVHLFLSITLLPFAVQSMPMKVSTSLIIRWILFSVMLGLILWQVAPLLESGIMSFIGLFGGGIMTLFLIYLLKFHQLIQSPKEEIEFQR